VCCDACFVLLLFTSTRQHTSAFVSTRPLRRLRACCDACFVLLFTSIRQHTSAYVSIRQHTSTSEVESVLRRLLCPVCVCACVESALRRLFCLPPPGKCLVREGRCRWKCVWGGACGVCVVCMSSCCELSYKTLQSRRAHTHIHTHTHKEREMRGGQREREKSIVCCGAC
jgi:hypothetical protein